MTVWENEKPETFLRVLEHTSNARNWCRKIILAKAQSVLEIGVGGLNERRALGKMGFIGDYTGTDVTFQFIENGIQRYPDDDWICVDVNNLLTKVYDRHDIVYSQHVLEHCSGIGTPLTNMLKRTGKVLLNIFFLMPNPVVETINWFHYPCYHNVYSMEHIGTICDRNGFDHEFKMFNNDEFLRGPRNGEDVPIPPREMVLIATRREQ